MDKQQFDDLKARVAALEASATSKTWQPPAPSSRRTASELSTDQMWLARTAKEAEAARVARPVLTADGWFVPHRLLVDQ